MEDFADDDDEVCDLDIYVVIMDQCRSDIVERGWWLGELIRGI